ncbi:uncharacterized protein B0H18DRAFT_1112849 [Fomitopsis serialis]|uniref:uncharacterized protein n=1 Tax=Fomitopsis serialis TaxID=139415 RepID=UPI002008AFD7|nr:uncharacterized protein B0H18DRAFT_1112849 [Neoantrodia serialis]KAH9938728.1 hypothetical protein B0H18DRAFT_1112849 [Neoantrodia serialis]
MPDARQGPPSSPAQSPRAEGEGHPWKRARLFGHASASGSRFRQNSLRMTPRDGCEGGERTASFAASNPSGGDPRERDQIPHLVGTSPSTPTPVARRARAQGTTPARLRPIVELEPRPLCTAPDGRAQLAVKLSLAALSTSDEAGEIEREIRAASGIEQGSVQGPGSRGRRRLYRTVGAIDIWRSQSFTRWKAGAIPFRTRAGGCACLVGWRCAVCGAVAGGEQRRWCRAA